MLTPAMTHDWNLSPTQAVTLQRELASSVREVKLARLPSLVAGADCAFCSNGEEIIAGWVVWDVKRQKLVEEVVAVERTTFPYVPGLLSFRETPAMLAAAAKLSVKPDLLMFDGHGRAHPRRFGIASHVGLLLDLPSIGCAKSRLCGEHKEPAPSRGACVSLVDGDEKIGRVLRTRERLKPVFVSVGHKITLDGAVDIVLRCCTRYRLPEPTRLAHMLVTREKANHAP